MIKAVFFDMYGTLAGFSPSRYKIQSRACAAFGIDVTPEGITAGYASADAYMARQNSTSPVRLRSQDERERFFAEYERLILAGAGVAVTVDRALEVWHAIREIPYGLAPFDDVVPVMGRLATRGLVLGLITNIDRDGAELATSVGLAEHLDVVVTSGEVGADKPAPEIFAEALRRAGVEAGEAVHVGDQPTSDIDGALAAGLSAVLLDRDGNYRDFDRCPRIEGLRELPDLLDELDSTAGSPEAVG
jgi:HAD superfamily hydrolase (TIGR01549 family)